MKQEVWRRVEEVFHAALERAPDARQRFLDGICDADTEVRRQVELLLAKGEQAGSFLEVPALADATAALTAGKSLLGRQFGPYQIVNPLGAGGMGEVYRAHDIKLGRDVAVKTLPHEFAHDEERLSRLRREARTLASLNHPNIGAIYGLEESEEADCLVMELIEGEMLRGPLPVPTALDRAGQVAAALEAAHGKGVIHRDLKPANIKVTPQGTVKVLDFGLAKAICGPEGNPEILQSAPPTGVGSVAGQIVGTPGYMSPEQARGGEVDKRTDIWAFGCLLYELLTGERAFPGETQQDTIAAVLEREPDWEALPARTPALVRELLRRCLQKDAGRRLQSIADARRTIESAQQGWNRWRVAAIAAAALAMLAIGAEVAAYFWTRPAPVLKVSYYAQLTHDGQLKSLIGTDGARLYLGVPTMFAYKAITEVSISGGEPTPIPAPSPDMFAVDVSADGSKLLALDTKASTVVAPAPLWSLPLLGGAPRRLGDTVGEDAAWSPDGGMLAYAHGGDLFLAKADGTESHKLATTKNVVRHLVWSPDGSHLQFDALENVDLALSSLWEVSLDGTDLHRLLPGRGNSPYDCCGSWTADGKYFVFQSNNQIWALRRNWGGFLHSEPKLIQLTFSPLSLSSPLPSKDGKKLFVIGELHRGELTRYDSKSGQFSPFLGGISAEYVANSNDGQWVAYVSYPEGALWRSKPDRSQRLQLTYSPFNPWLPRWSPDGKTIVFWDRISERIYEVSPEGGSPRQLIPDDQREQGDPNWSPGGDRIVFGSGRDNTTPLTIRILNLASRQVSTLPGSQGLFSPRWSPDGRYIVAMKDDSSALLLFDFQIQKWIELGESVFGWPNWSKDGQYVYVLDLTGRGAVLRFRISDHKAEQVVDLKNFVSGGQAGNWLALAPDDSPLLLRDAGSQDVYAFDWEAP